MSGRNWLFCFLVSLLCLLFLVLIYPPMVGHCADENAWYVYDIINPSLDHIYWSETGSTREPPSYIRDGSWYNASMSQSLVGSNDIFVQTYEQFNWSLVRPTAENYYGVLFSSFSAFQNWVTQNPGPWLRMSWKIDTQWYGVSLNTTKVVASFNEITQTVELSTWLHITRVPEYLVGEGFLGNWLEGFDLTPVSIGSLDLWEFHEDLSKNGTYYNLRFEAPADVLTQHGNIYNCSVPVIRNYWGNTFKSTLQMIDINMPANTEANAASPTDMSTLKGNTATFYIAYGDTYPQLFTATSGPPAKSPGQAFLESASVWAFAPTGWAAIASLLLLGITGIRGRTIWRRNKMYHRLYKSMVTVYDLYYENLPQFQGEMENISKSVFKSFVEDRITDDQFERLLKRRDDLLARSKKD